MAQPAQTTAILAPVIFAKLDPVLILLSLPAHSVAQELLPVPELILAMPGVCACLMIMPTLPTAVFALNVTVPDHAPMTQLKTLIVPVV